MKYWKSCSLLFLFTFSLCLTPQTRLAAQTIKEALTSGAIIYVTFNGNDCQNLYKKVFKCGETYEVAMNENTWYARGYHSSQNKIIIDNNYSILNEEPGARYRGDAGSFSIFGANFAFNSFDQFYPAGMPNKILGIMRISLENVSEQQVCSLNDLPAGWVVTDINNLCICCGSQAGSFGTEFTIKKIDGLESGSTQEVCLLENIPAGWVITAINHLCICCGSAAGSFGTKWTITKISGMPKGSTQVVCSIQNIPGGWGIINIDNRCICCGSKAGSFGTQWTIKNI